MTIHKDGPNGSTTKILWFLLTLSAGILATVLGAWAIERNTVDRELGARMTAIERQYEAINTKLDQLLAQHRK